jgi:hypothetical protein
MALPENVHRARWRAPLMTLAVFAAAWLVLELGHPPVPLHDDTHEDLLQARVCLEEGRCPTVGVSTTVPGVAQGALWVNALAALRAVPVSVGAIHGLTFALAAASIALLFAYLLVRRGRPRLAWAAAALCTLGWLHGGTLHVPWNPSLSPLPAALLLVLALEHAERGRWWGALPLGLALGLTLETHPVAVLAVPGTLLLAGMACRRGAAALLAPALTGATALGLYAAMSPGAALQNGVAALRAAGTPLLVGAVALPGVALLLQPRFRRARARPRDLLAALALALPPLAVVVGTALLSDEAPVGPRYLSPALPAVALLAAEALAPALSVRGAPAALAVGAALLALWPATRHEAGIRRLAALEAVRTALEADGLTLDHAFARVSGPACQPLVGGLAAVGMPLGRPANGELRPRSLVVAMADELADLGASPDDLARGRWRTVPTPVGPALLGELATWVDRRRFTACVFTEADGEPTCGAHDLGEGIRAVLGEHPPLLPRLTDPSVRWRRDGAGRRWPRRVVYRLPVRIPPRAGQRTVFVPTVAGEACRVHRFVDAEGLRLGSPLGGEALVLESTDAPQRGALAVEVAVRGCPPFALEVFPPCLSERAPEDGPALRRLLGEPRDR